MFAFNPTQARRRRIQRQRLDFQPLEDRRLRAGMAGDFNGDGIDDLAVGIPLQVVAGKEAAGSVQVTYGSSAGPNNATVQHWTQDNIDSGDGPEAGDQFGFALAAGDINGDGYDDLAIGIRYEDIVQNGRYAMDAGAVHVLYGSPNGLQSTGTDFWYQGKQTGVLTRPIDDRAETGDHFGARLTIADFDNDGYDDLVVSAFREDIELDNGEVIQDAGAVQMIRGSYYGLTGSRESWFWTQGGPHVGDQAEAGDFFGSALEHGDFNADGYQDLVIGAKFEDVGQEVDAGAIHVIYGHARGLGLSVDPGLMFITQNSGSSGEQAEAGDQFGASLAAGDFNGDGADDLAIGAPREDLVTYTWQRIGFKTYRVPNPVPDAGVVNVIYGHQRDFLDPARGGAYQTIDQSHGRDSAGHSWDSFESYDNFGFALAASDLNGDGRFELAVSAPWEDLGSISDAGVVHIFQGSSLGLSGSNSQYWHQNLSGVYGTSQSGDRFGMALQLGDYDGDSRLDLAVAVPGEDAELGGWFGSRRNAGGVQVFYGNGDGVDAHRDAFFSQAFDGTSLSLPWNDEFMGVL